MSSFSRRRWPVLMYSTNPITSSTPILPLILTHLFFFFFFTTHTLTK